MKILSAENQSQLIKKLIPHRYPMLLIDRIVEIVPGSYAKVLKNITHNESIFQGHFPLQPIFPGVLIIEAVGQAFSAAYYLSSWLESGKSIEKMISEECKEYHSELEHMRFLTKVDFKFLKKVIVGDQMLIHLNFKQIGSRTQRVYAQVQVDRKIVAEGTLSGVVKG